MAFLDFIKSREGQRSAAEQQSPKPETAKQMYTREAVQERANAKPVDHNLTAEQRVVVSSVQAKMPQLGEQPNEGPAPLPTPTDSASSPQAEIQKWENQDKASPALSPTSLQAGKTESEIQAPSVTAEGPTAEKTPSPSPSPDPSATPTPRGRGWER